MNVEGQMLALEEQLLHLDHRADPAALEALLAADFEEVASSGHRADRKSVITWLLNKDPSWRWQLSQLAVSEPAPGLRLVRYHGWQSEPPSGSKGAWHSSLWRQDAAGRWQLWFHQATRLPS